MTLGTGRNACILGASRGIGLALVCALLRRDDVARVYATARQPEQSEALCALRAEHGDRLRLLALDVREEPTIARAAGGLRAAAEKLHLLVHCAGVLHDGDGLRPEKRLADVEPSALRRAFEVNAFGPLLVAKHFAPLLRHEERAVLANLSARVGSIGDNRARGWYAYRASKAAQNMFTKTLALELARSAPRVICVALHPGTVDTALSRPFQRSVPAAQLQRPEEAAARLLAVLDALTPADHGAFLDKDGLAVPW